MPFFSKVFRSKDAAAAKAKKLADQGNGGDVAPPKPRWEDAWSRKEVAPEEVQELIHRCTQELKSRALDTPFLLLPFRPGADASSSRIFIGKYFKARYDGNDYFSGNALQQELKLTEPMVLCSIMKWCWSRLPGGVVTWDVYEIFKIGEQDSRMAAHAFDTFIPIAVDSDARKLVIFDFFDLLAAIAARGKTNGLGGRKLSRMAGWWAFEHSDDGNGFDGGYKSWQTAADAASHLFFAYLRSLSPENVAGASGISQLPRSLQSLLSQTEYPPERPTLMFTTTSKVVMIVDSVSPTPFALLRRTRNFEYREDDYTLSQFSQYEDPVKALTDECRRVLNSISSTNQSSIASNTTSKAQDPSWSRFEDLGFSGLEDTGSPAVQETFSAHTKAKSFSGAQANGDARFADLGRPTTPSWAEFLSTGFKADGDNIGSTSMLLPPDKVLPPIGEARGHSSQSHVRNGNGDAQLEPGELASIGSLELDDTFWWVWMTSLASEEPAERKAVFGRCALIETNIVGGGGRWLIIEEQVKGASPAPDENAYFAEKKSRFSFRKNRGLSRRKSTGKKANSTLNAQYNRSQGGTPYNRLTIGADQQAKIQAAAQRLVRNSERPQDRAPNRAEETSQTKTTSMMTVGTNIMSEASPAMKWAKQYDRGEIRAQYLGDPAAGTGRSVEHLQTIPSSSTLPVTENAYRTRSNDGQNAQVPSSSPPQPSHGLLANSTPQKAAAAPLPSPPETPQPKQEHVVAAEIPIHKPEEKPAPIDQPILRESPTNVATEHEQQAPPSPETERSVRSKLKKEQALNKKKEKSESGGGLKKLFTKKGKENRVSRAAPAQQFQQTETFTEVPDAVAEPDHAEDSMDLARDEPLLSVPDAGEDASQSDLSRTHTSEERDATQEFNRFDQGPLQDVPAFVPHDSLVQEEDTAPSPPDFGPARTSVPASAMARKPVQTMPDPEAAAPAPSVPIAPREEASPAPSAPSVIDRWAQIRKEAAERAQRMSEDPNVGGTSVGAGGAKSNVRSSYGAHTEDGDTSGEETIESRVARIKARVAELTGNMEGQSSIRR